MIILQQNWPKALRGCFEMRGEKAVKIIPVGELANHRYIIPIYQRNYAWTPTEVGTLIDDIKDAWESKKQSEEDRPYYIGTLVVAERDDGRLEVIDGQQRLTTLCLLLKALGSTKKLPLEFECRPRETEALEAPDSMPAIYDAYDEACKSFHNSKNNDRKISDVGSYRSYLEQKVLLLQAKLPRYTDLNHYFEIMNNRGAQLEKHEILKAWFMEKMQDERERNTFALIWDACSQMDGYVVRHFFRGEKNAAEKRKILFGNDLSDCPDKFDIFLARLRKAESLKSEDQTNGAEKEVPDTLGALLDASSDFAGQDKKGAGAEEPDEYQSIIQFPNFLLHVLRRVRDKENIPLDDKQLLRVFKKSEIISVDGARTFALALLQCRLLFDRYVIKSHSKARWALRKIAIDKTNKLDERNTFGETEEQGAKWQEPNVMIQAMFHVSFPRQNYRHWLDGLLGYLYGNRENGIDGKRLLAYMERMCDHFFFQRFSNEPKEYDDILENLDSQDDASEWQIDTSKLHVGTGVPNFVFNRLDYILWKKNKKKFEGFHFTYRTSVEHFYPQHPNSLDPLGDKDLLNHFGNLCLISRSANSKFSNASPTEKRNIANSKESDQEGLQSLKLKLMLSKADEWNGDEIERHGQEMIEVLTSPINASWF